MSVTATSTAKTSGTRCRPIGLGNARIGTTRPQEELVSKTNEPETINNIACVRAEKAKVDNAAARVVPLNARLIRPLWQPTRAQRATYKSRCDWEILAINSSEASRNSPFLAQWATPRKGEWIIAAAINSSDKSTWIYLIFYSTIFRDLFWNTANEYG